MTEKQQTVLSVLFDFISALIVWFLFYAYRVTQIENSELVFKGSFFKGLLLVPMFWVFLYVLQGTYRNVHRGYRLKTIKQTFFGTLLGTIVVFFVLLLNDYVYSYTQFYTIILVLFSLHFFITLIPRLIIITIHVKRIHSRKFGFDTIIIGGSSKAIEILDEIKKLNKVRDISLLVL